MNEIFEQAIDVAIESRKKAIAKNTKVGVCIVMNDGQLYGGANFENSPQKTPHAEEVALIRALYDGYRQKDFEYMIQLMFGTKKFPCCFHCLGWLWEWAHPDFLVYTVNAETREIADVRSLRKLSSGYDGVDIYPNPERRLI